MRCAAISASSAVGVALPRAGSRWSSGMVGALSTDGRVNAFLSVAEGDRAPRRPAAEPGRRQPRRHRLQQQPALVAHSQRLPHEHPRLHSSKSRSAPTSRSRRASGLWMNITGSRTKNIPGLVDPRELYGKLEGRWGSFLAGSDLSLFGRGATLMDQQIAHDFGLGSPCDVEFASGGGCGMTGFGEPFPGFEPGFVYATPNLGGLQLSVGAYDPATISNAQLNRAPVPRVEGEASYAIKNIAARVHQRVLAGAGGHRPGDHRGRDDVSRRTCTPTAGAFRPGPWSRSARSCWAARRTRARVQPDHLSRRERDRRRQRGRAPQFTRRIRPGRRLDRRLEAEDRGRGRASGSSTRTATTSAP